MQSIRIYSLLYGFRVSQSCDSESFTEIRQTKRKSLTHIHIHIGSRENLTIGFKEWLHFTNATQKIIESLLPVTKEAAKISYLSGVITTEISIVWC